MVWSLGLPDFFSDVFLKSSSSSRGLTDEPVESEPVVSDVPVLLDAFFNVMMQRLDVIEAKLDEVLKRGS